MCRLLHCQLLLTKRTIPTSASGRKPTGLSFSRPKKARPKEIQPPNSMKPRGKTRISESDENVNDQYLEKEDGSTMGGTEAGELRALLRGIFSEQKMVDPENMPPNWGSAAISFRNYVFNQVYLKFPCLQLCRSDWKVSQIAGTTYSSWKTHGKQKNKAVKDELELNDVKIQATEHEDLNPTLGDEPARAVVPAKRPLVPDSDAIVSKSPKRPCPDLEASSRRFKKNLFFMFQ
jgi:hypothetical protein